MATLPLDLSQPSFRAAYHHARMLAVQGDRKGADALFARLLWHVPAADGGFIGLSDAQLEDKVAGDPRLTMEAVNAAMWNPGDWPAQPAMMVAA